MRILRRGSVGLGRRWRPAGSRSRQPVGQNLVDALPERLLQLLDLTRDGLPEAHLLLADVPELPVPIVDEAVPRTVAEADERVDDKVAQQQRRVVDVLVSATGRLGNDRVHDAELEAIR